MGVFAAALGRWLGHPWVRRTAGGLLVAMGLLALALALGMGSGAMGH